MPVSAEEAARRTPVRAGGAFDGSLHIITRVRSSLAISGIRSVHGPRTAGVLATVVTRRAVASLIAKIPLITCSFVLKHVCADHVHYSYLTSR